MDLDDYQEFAKERIGFEFHDINLLVTALTHRSYLNEDKTVTDHNERLEFLGDAILEMVTSDFLFRNFDLPEGVMTALRSALVRTESIGEAGRVIGYEPFVRMSKGEINGSIRGHDTILADCFEAVVGAIYVDQGYSVAREFIRKHILSKIDIVLEEESWRDTKSYFQELTQQNDGVTPTYRLLREEGPDHYKTFTIGVYVGNVLKGVGIGHSKQDAQTEAARKGLKKYKEELAEMMGVEELPEIQHLGLELEEAGVKKEGHPETESEEAGVKKEGHPETESEEADVKKEGHPGMEGGEVDTEKVMHPGAEGGEINTKKEMSSGAESGGANTGANGHTSEVEDATMDREAHLEPEENVRLWMKNDTNAGTETQG